MSESHLIFIMICVVVSLRIIIIGAAIMVRRTSQSTVALPRTSIVASRAPSDLADDVRDEFPAVLIIFG